MVIVQLVVVLTVGVALFGLHIAGDPLALAADRDVLAVPGAARRRSHRGLPGVQQANAFSFAGSSSFGASGVRSCRWRCFRVGQDDRC